jgi:competence protein ComEC
MRLSFYILILGFLAGVLWRSLFSIPSAGVLALVVGAGVLYAVGRMHDARSASYVVLALLACAVGVVRTEFAYRAYEGARVYDDHTVLSGSATVAFEPDVRDDHTVLVLDVDAPDAQTAGIRVRASVPPYPAYEYGDRVTVRGELVKPRAFETDTGRTFKYDGYLMKDGIHYEVRNAVVRASGEYAGNPAISFLLAAKQRWLAAVSQLMPEPDASLAGGLIVGAKRSLGDQWLDAFRTVGLIHIVVLSGYNLSLVARTIVQMTMVLPQMLGFGLGVAGVVGFALMTGASATVIRASVMAILGMLATFSTRPYAVVRALAFAAFLMVAWSPFTLLFDPGFQLSFLATVGLIYGSPLIEARLGYVTARWGLRGIVAATLSTQLAVLPLLLYQIGQVSLVAPVVNVLVLPLVSSVMAIGFVAGVIGMVSTAVATPIAWGAYALLHYMFFIVRSFAALPFAAVGVPVVSWWVLVLMYVGLVWGYLAVTKRAARPVMVGGS